MKNKLTIIRGVPGSGKSTKARAIIAESAIPVDHFEADMYHMKDGVYNWKLENMKKAHSWCQNQTRNSLKSGKSVIVSNTFVKLWEMDVYLDMAKELGVEVDIITMKTQFQNVHNVPDDKVAEMRSRFEPLLTEQYQRKYGSLFGMVTEITAP